MASLATLGSRSADSLIARASARALGGSRRQTHEPSIFAVSSRTLGFGSAAHASSNASPASCLVRMSDHVISLSASSRAALSPVASIFAYSSAVFCDREGGGGDALTGGALDADVILSIICGSARMSWDSTPMPSTPFNFSSIARRAFRFGAARRPGTSTRGREKRRQWARATRAHACGPIPSPISDLFPPARRC